MKETNRGRSGKDSIRVRGTVISDCRSKVKTFEGSGWCDLYDRAPSTPPERLSQHDLLILAGIGGGTPRFDDTLALWNRRREIEQSLARIPPKSSLLNDSVGWGDLEALFRPFLATRGYGVSRASKILHRKRPQLIPIMDNEAVTGAFFPEFISGVQDKDPKTAVSLLKAIRLEVLGEKATLRSIRDELVADLSILRVWDMILWAEYDSH